MNHKTIKRFVKFDENNSARNGILKPNMFQAVCQSGEGKIDKGELEKYLIALGLAVEMKNEAIFLPSLISDDNEVQTYNLAICIKLLFRFPKFPIQMLRSLSDSSRMCLMPVLMRGFSAS